MNIIKEMLLNQLIRIPYVMALAMRRHNTGMVNDQAKVDEKLAILKKSSTITDLDVLEIGPGQTFGVLAKLSQAGASSISAVDISKYLCEKPDELKFATYDGSNMPFDNESFNLVYSFSVLEHVREPKQVVNEIYRVLKPGGKCIHLIDMVDHFNYDWKVEEKDFHCLKYPDWLWNLMTINRSNYVNRVRKSAWISMFQEAGFSTKILLTSENEAIRKLWATNKINYLKNFSEEDAITRSILIEATKCESSEHT